METKLHVQVQNSNQDAEEKYRDAIRQIEGNLLAFIRNRVPNWVDPEDVLQDVMYQFSATGIETIDQVSSWLYTVARNRITDLYRKRSMESTGHKISLGDKDDDAIYLADILPDISQSPEVRFVQNEIMDALEEALDELPEEQKEVFVMHELESMKFKQISELTGVSVNTLLSRKRYAIKYLRERLSELYEELNQ